MPSATLNLNYQLVFPYEVAMFLFGESKGREMAEKIAGYDGPLKIPIPVLSRDQTGLGGKLACLPCRFGGERVRSSG
jgi:hypothetical protein